MFLNEGCFLVGHALFVGPVPTSRAFPSRFDCQNREKVIKSSEQGVDLCVTRDVTVARMGPPTKVLQTGKRGPRMRRL